MYYLIHWNQFDALGAVNITTWILDNIVEHSSVIAFGQCLAFMNLLSYTQSIELLAIFLRKKAHFISCIHENLLCMGYKNKFILRFGRKTVCWMATCRCCYVRSAQNIWIIYCWLGHYKHRTYRTKSNIVSHKYLWVRRTWDQQRQTEER